MIEIQVKFTSLDPGAGRVTNNIWHRTTYNRGYSVNCEL